MTDAVHAAGGAIAAQLGHAGVVASKKITGVTAMSPSRVINPSSLEYCREITASEIRRVIDQFGDAAAIAVEAGFDAVELHFGHLYLPSSFLSPLLNRRKTSTAEPSTTARGSCGRSRSGYVRSWEIGSR